MKIEEAREKRLDEWDLIWVSGDCKEMLNIRVSGRGVALENEMEGAKIPDEAAIALRDKLNELYPVGG